MKKISLFLILALISIGSVSYSVPSIKPVTGKKAIVKKKPVVKKKPIIKAKPVILEQPIVIKRKIEVEKIEIIKPVEPPASLPEIKKRPFLLLEAGYFGGAGGIKAGYILPRDIYQLEPHLNIGYGIGQSYGVTLIQAELANYDGPYSVGVSYDIATYSTRVLGLPGLPDAIEKGSRASLGGFIGKQLLGVEVKLGYSSALGFVVLVAGKRT